MTKPITHILIIFVFLFLALLFLPISIFGQDGYSLWFPIIHEYLKGDQTYQASQIIFQGQNELAIYGALPFWKLLRLFQPSYISFINITYFFWFSLTYALFLIIYRGLRQRIDPLDFYLIAVYCLLSPIATNRLMAGHFNLMFGMLPFLVYVALIFEKRPYFLALYIFAIWCAFSIQSYQILVYHLFVLPIWLFFFLRHEPNKKKYIFWCLGLTAIAFLLNINTFFKMYEHATGSGNLRQIGYNAVYTYTVTEFIDLYNLFFSSFNSLSLTKNFGFFHELNYPLGVFIVLLFIQRRFRSYSYFFAFTFIICLLFSMNLPPINLLSKLPLLNSFRVPQRAFMILAFITPVYMLAYKATDLKLRDISLLLFLTFVGTFIDYFELYVLVIILVLLAFEKIQIKYFNRDNLIAMFALSTIFLGNNVRTQIIENEYDNYKMAMEALRPIKNLSFSEKANNIFHFETSNPHLINYVAKLLDIKTVEGYGHPPAKLVHIYSSITGEFVDPMTVSFYLSANHSKYHELLKAFHVTRVVTFPNGSEPLIEKVTE